MGRFPLAPAAALAALLAAAARAQEGIEAPVPPARPEPLPPAQEVLARVRGGFPVEPLLVLAELVREDADGREGPAVHARLLLEWGALVPTARYVLADAFGAPLAQLAVSRPPGGAARWRYYEGDPPAERPLPDPDAAVAGTDFAWSDLALNFLWWPGGETTGTESRRGRECYVVRVPAPEPRGACAEARLWVDRHVFALLEAEARDAEGRPLRRLSVKSLRKMDGQWTLQDLEVRTPAAGTRTRLHVRESRRIGEAAAPAAAVPPAREEPAP